MAKNFLAFMGLLFLTLLIVAGVALIGIFYDEVGIVSLPEDLLSTPAGLLEKRPIDIQVMDVGEAEWSNPLDLLPTPTIPPQPTATPTPVPPMDPEVYRTEVVMQLRHFANALENWLAINDRLAADNSLLENPSWQEDVKSALDEVAISARVLAGIGPAPDEYQQVQSWLERVSTEASGLREHYYQALDTGDTGHFSDAAENFTRLKEYLTGAAKEMLAQGWTLQ